MSLLSWLLAILAGLSLAAMVVAITIAKRSTREARSTIFPVVREEEIVRARRAHIVTSVMGVIAAIMAGAFFLSGQLPALNIPTLPPPAEFIAIVASPVVEAEPPAVEAEAATTSTEIPLSPTVEQRNPTGSQMELVTPQPPSDETPALSATPTPVSPTLIPTIAPSTTVSSSRPSSPTADASPVPVPADMELGPIAFSTEVTERHEPINASTVFSDTTSRVYATFPYSGMRNGLTWTQVWYFNDSEFNRREGVWQWGSVDRSFIFTKLVGAGDYRLELYVNDDLVTSGKFTVQGPLAIGGPEIPPDPGTPEDQTTQESQQAPETPRGTIAPESP